MEFITTNEIIEAIHGELVLQGEKIKHNNICIDTRIIKDEDVFIAIKGENFNANDYALEASKKGASICIIDDMKFEKSEFNKKTSVIKVEDTKKALLMLAKFYINKLNIKVVGITGSTGKTSTKDLVAAVLSAKFKVFKTLGNFNNEIGLPMMIFKLDKSYDVAVLEMGMSDFKEIHNLCEVAKPDIAIITNIGMSHIENLKTRENILKAKMEITDFFSENGVLIVNSDNDLLQDITSKYKLIKTGIDTKADYTACNLNILENKIMFNIMDKGNLIETGIEVNIPGRHNILNSMLAVACARVMGMGYKEIAVGFKKLEVTSMRLNIKKGKRFTIINDCYNASPDSMVAAIDVLCDTHGNSKIAIFGTMKELGASAHDAHKQVGEYAKCKGIDLLITLGEFNEEYKVGFNDINKYRSFETYNEVVSFLDGIIKQGDVVLVKASRYMKFEGIVNQLENLNSCENINNKEVIEK
ncbi:UDP-N-acetylmuramoyl-tripeptide--D-alanyl-D-alanine ligase [Clostridium estertheticum]|uniref:UDP-N-acetylmuramoyl-tripeptide--D-alanyl-D- alanine ligase n=1 Tax=Clostridium estertheticum TaxID=238834 RepID=UPI001C7DEDB6|nr:UDP-N-acetylmuramoyl-tripeptide--D-alanyl-D-alanine ligase [Clostridium estertheticum]MBX4269255.1 UDP-N-acetylmuramoyl-tripeptide--D-alanyl-D-alanine ligase [Clostridium estertheticum]WLC79393.1 UDP-N-acetylmuramoyl-tripeptide--D-alanyl-D-alanine ligase [Clostridium estertheticum]